MNSPRSPFRRLLAPVLLLTSLLFIPQGMAQVTVTPANISASADTATAGTFTAVTGPVLTETGAGDLSGTITLTAPTGWVFDTAQGSATATNAGSGVSNLTIGAATVTTSSVSVTTSTTTGGSRRGTITFSNLRVRPSTVNSATGTMTVAATPTALAFAVGSSSTAGTFNITPGAPSRLAFAVQPVTTASFSAISPAVTVQIQDAGGRLTTSTASVTLAGGSGTTLGSASTLTVSAVNGTASFSNILPSAVGSGKTLTAASAGLTGATSAAFQVSMSLSAPASSWRTTLQGANFDYINDQQATAADLELVGNAGHPVLYRYYDDAGTPTVDTDDFLYLRVRLAGSKSNSLSQFSSGYLFLGTDINNDGAIDFFISLTQRTSREQRISVWGTGTGANNSPNTTTIGAEIPVVDLATSPGSGYVAFAPVTTVSDPTVTDVNLNDAALGTTALALGVNDHFLSFKIPFSNTSPAVDSLKEALAAKGIPLTQASPLRMLLGTSTQSNSLNSDLNGYQGGTKSALTFASQGTLTSPLALLNDFPVITSNGGGASASLIAASGTSGSTVTTVAATDPEGQTVTYAITGGANSAAFAINPATGVLTFSSTQVPGVYVVTVQASDPSGGTSTQTLTVTVSDPGDITLPTVLSVTSSKANGHYKTGEVIPVQVTFSEPVVVAGSPALTLGTGNVLRTANYVSGSGSNVLLFNYTVVSGDSSSDLDYTGAASLVLGSGGSIADAKPNNADLRLPLPGAAASLGGSKALVIDTVAPAYVSGTASGTSVVLTFSDVNLLDGVNPPPASAFAVTIAGSPATVLRAVTDGTAKTVTLTLASASGDGQQVAVTYTDPTTDADDSFAIQDLAGNDRATFTAPAISATGDVVAPVVVGISAYDLDADSQPVLVNGHFAAGGVIPVRVEFSETVTASGTPQLTLETGTTDRVVSYVSGSGGTVLLFNYTVQAGDTSADLDVISPSALALNGGSIRDLAASPNNAVLTVPAAAAAGSLGANNDIVVDTTVPVIATREVSGSTLRLSYTEANSLDPTAPPAIGSFAVTVAGAARAVTAVSVDAVNDRILLTLASPATTGEAVTVAYTDPTAGNDANATQDLAGNDAATFAATAVTNLSGDATAPTLTSINDNDADDAVINNSTLTYTVTFSEDIDAATFTAADLANAGTAGVTIGSITETSPGVFSVQVTATTTGTIQLRIAAGATVLDASGNALVTTSALAGGATNGTVTVGKSPQTITFAALGAKVFGQDPPFTLSATASSGLTPGFTVVSGPATVSGTTLTLTGMGTVTVRASQPGDAVFAAASDVDRAFAVTGIAGSSEINLRGGTVSIRDGNRRIQEADNTDFGVAQRSGGLPVTKTFTIENLGTGTLELTGTPVVAISGIHLDDFTVLQPAFSAVQPGGSVSFSVSYQPISVGQTHSAVITIASGDSDEGSYDFGIRGTAKDNLAPIDLTLSGGRLANQAAVPGAPGLLAGTLTARPDLGERNTYSLVAAVSGDLTVDDDNGKFTIVGNTLYLSTGETGSKTNIDTKPRYKIHVQVSDDNSQTYAKAFQVIVMNKVLSIGDFLLADRGPYGSTGTVLRVSKDGILRETVNTALKDPYEITTDADGNFVIANYDRVITNGVVSENGGIYRLDLATGAQTKVIGGAPFVTPLGVKVESDGKYIVVDADYVVNNRFTGGVFRVDPANPATPVLLTTSGNISYLQGVALSPLDGQIYVSNVIFPRGGAVPAQILKVDKVTGAQTVLTSSGLLNYPVGIDVEEDGASLVVADALAGKLIRVDLSTGAQTLVSADPLLRHPTHIAIEADGNYLVTDGRSTAMTRRLMRVDKGTGIATEIVIDDAGSAFLFDQPRGVTIVK